MKILLPLLYWAETIMPNVDPVKRAGTAANDNTMNDIVGVVFGIAGALALLFIVIGGLRYILSDGDPNNISQAKKTIIYALVGLVITMAAYAIVSFVLNNI